MYRSIISSLPAISSFHLSKSTHFVPKQIIKMAKLIAALLLVAALIAAASSQYLAGYRGVGLAYGGYRGAYAGAPVGLGYAGLGHPGYLGAYGAYRGAYLG